MKASQTPLFTTKEISREAQVPSHQLLLRAGYIHKQASGFYSYLPFGRITHHKIEQIVREQMEKFGAFEVRLPVLTQAGIWRESGRWSEMGPELIRLKDRHQNDYCLAPTHEEAITHLSKTYLKSYKQLPVNFFQIGTKYRDEIRPRYGLIRCREFVMKDAYSFHATDSSLDATYEKMRECYRSIFDRCGIHTIPVQADSAGMGGAYSEEFMVVSEIGESTLLLAEDENSCSYRANQEKTEFIPRAPYPVGKSTSPPKLVDTPDVSSIEDVENFLNRKSLEFIKAVVYEDAHHIIISFIPGDRDISLTKLKEVSGLSDIEMASHETIQQALGCPPGFIGPHKLSVSDGEEVLLISDKVKSTKKILLYYDRNLMGRGNLIGGGNQKDSHYINLEEGRDFVIPGSSQNIDLVEAKGGDLCPADTSQKLVEKKGIELGHIFKLGTKYSEKMKLNVLDANGKNIPPIMGCYGIGIDRTLQAFVEQNHDEHGLVWSDALSPYDVYLVSVFNTSEELKKHEEVYDTLIKEGFRVYFDDRKERAGVKFHDADLVGFPWQVIAGKHWIQSGRLELKSRKSMQKEEVSLNELLQKLGSE